MSIVFSKKKEKRSRSSISESNNSFVKNVTSRVSGLLPATITKWFSSPSSSSANESAAAAEATDSSTEDEATESPITTQPPAKRMRYTSPGSKFNKYTPPEPATPSHSDSQDLQSGHLLYNTIQSPPGRNTFLREKNYASTPYMPPAYVSNIDVVNIDRADRDLTYKSPHIVSATSISVATKRKSIFESLVTKEEPVKPSAPPPDNTYKEVRQPSYKPALFGSPFYPGRTMYGGASHSTYINQPNIKQRKVTYVRESKKDNDNVNMSYSARRVMDLLENYSSPLMEAKRMPVYRKPNNSTLANVSSPGTSKVYSYKTQELHLPSLVSIMHVKQRSRLMDTTKIARQIIASHSSTLSTGYQPYTVDNPKTSDPSKQLDKECTTKLKTRLTRPNRGEDPFNLPELVQLPTAVLQIDKDNLPKFSMSPPAAAAAPPPALTTSTPLPAPHAPTYKPLFTNAPPPPILAFNETTTPTEDYTDSTPRNIFKFASPVEISYDSPLNTITSPKFTFGNPGRNLDESAEDKISQPFSFSNTKIDTTVIMASKESKPSKDWKCPDCLITNKADVAKCVCCGAKQPSGDAKPAILEICSVCKLTSRLLGTDKCMNCEKLSLQGNKSIPLPIPQPADPFKWKCEGCWVTNEEKAEKCVACSTRNPKLAKATVAPKPAESAEKDWKCEDCLIRNNSSVEKCAACGGTKPGSKASAPTSSPAPASQPVFHSPFFMPPDEKLADIAKAQKTKWECSGCLVRNDTNKTECMCCGMEREGRSKEITPKPFTFPKESNTTFKFGIDPKEQESNIAKKAEETLKSEPTRKLKEPETNNNNIPTFTFTLPSKKLDDAMDSNKIKALEAPKMTFTFGVPKSVDVDAAAPAPAPASSFTADKSKTAAEEKPQEVPKIDFQAPAQEAKPFGSGFFAPPTTITGEETSPKSFSGFLPNSTPVSTKEVKETTINCSPFSSAGPSSEKSRPFSFASGGAGQTGTGTGLFGAVVTASSAAPTKGFSFSAPAITASPTVPLFQSPAPSAAPTMSIIFGNSAPESAAHVPAPAPAALPAPAPTSAPAPAPVTAAPLFSFGSNNQTAAPAADKPKFNFTFGNPSNKEASPFGSNFKGFGSDNSGASYAFAMPAPSPAATSASLATDALGDNGMSTSMGGGSDGSHNGMSSGMQTFGAPAAQENVWGASGSSATNVFGASTSSVQKPAPFTFGASNAGNPFNAGAPSTSAQPAPSLFGNQQPAQNPFGMASQSNVGQPGLFSSPAQQSQAPSIFGGAQPSANIFGSPSAAPSFGAPAQTVPSYEAPTVTPAPSFNFGAPQSSAIFGFGSQAQQQQPQQQPQQAGVYNFGGGNAVGGMSPAMGGGMTAGMGGGMMGQPMGGGMMNQPMGGVQFNMGSAPSTSVRRVRKAVRRNPQR